MGKGQAAIETLVIMAVSVAVLMVILTSSREKMSATDYNVQVAQAKTSLAKLASAAEFVYSQSVGAATDVSVIIPQKVADINVGGYSFEFLMSTDEGKSSSIIRATVARLNGTIDPSPGIKRVVLTNVGDYVQVT
jgi:Tfp pilus assembly protein PilE